MDDRQRLEAIVSVINKYLPPLGMHIMDAMSAIISLVDPLPPATQPAQEPVAKAWNDGYKAGVADERTSEANIGIAGFGAKIKPARQNPYGVAQPAQEPVAWMYQCTADNSGPVLLRHRTDWAESGTKLWIEVPLYTTQPQRPWVGLTNDERKALERFTETCDDGEGYDVPKQIMQRLAQIGVVHHTSGGVYSTTEFGRWVIDAAPPQRERVVFPTLLRKMWSGGEVQAWLDENVNKEKNNGT